MGLSFRDYPIQTVNLRSQSGQGVVEYILMMVVAIALIFGLAYQFNDAFRVWGENYFGDYTACLLETGELPAIGGTGGASSACADIFKPFNLADGRPYAGTGGTSGGGGSSSGGNGSGTDTSSNEENKEAKGSSESGDGASYSSTRKNQNGDFADRKRSGANGNQSDTSGINRRGRKTYTGSTEDSLAGSLSGGNRSGSRQRTRMLEGGYYLAKDSRADEQIDRAPAKISEGTRTERTNRMLIKKRPKSATYLEPDAPMTFGDYFRYLLIAAIIIALLIVVGGQLSQISADD